MLGYATGLIHPIQGGWHIDGPIDISFADGKWMLVVRDSRFHLFFEGHEPPDWETFRNEIASIVQGCMDALGFHLAASLRVEVASLVIDGNRLVTSTTAWPALASCLAQVSAAALGPFIQAATAEPLVRLALADLRAALDAPDDTLFLAYRAVETSVDTSKPAIRGRRKTGHRGERSSGCVVARLLRGEQVAFWGDTLIAPTSEIVPL